MATLSRSLAVFLIISLVPQSVMKDWAKMLVVWNVGQGQWLTYIDRNSCDHFDMGGERAPISLVIDFCQRSRNRVWLSHGDWDHISFLTKSQLPDLCLASRRPFVKSRQKISLLNRLRTCGQANPSWLSTVWEPIPAGKSTNDSSLVFKIGETLIPGDSTKAQEKYWGRSTELARAKTLVLGHHGSRTSTGKFLLSRLPQLRQSIASSRRSRYGHPHYEVVKRLFDAKVPLVTTEDWGTLRLDF